MCLNPYAAQWRHTANHCPNLVPDNNEKQKYDKPSFPVNIKFDQDSRYHYDSLVHLWSKWYRQYFDVDYPILMGTSLFFFRLLVSPNSPLVSGLVRSEV